MLIQESYGAVLGLIMTNILQQGREKEKRFGLGKETYGLSIADLQLVKKIQQPSDFSLEK